MKILILLLLFISLSFSSNMPSVFTFCTGTSSGQERCEYYLPGSSFTGNGCIDQTTHATNDICISQFLCPSSACQFETCQDPTYIYQLNDLIGQCENEGGQHTYSCIEPIYTPPEIIGICGFPCSSPRAQQALDNAQQYLGDPCLAQETPSVYDSFFCVEMPGPNFEIGYECVAVSSSSSQSSSSFSSSSFSSSSLELSWNLESKSAANESRLNLLV